MLGMEWERYIEAGTSILHQRAFTEKLLKAFGFWQYSKLTKTSQASGTRLSVADKPAWVCRESGKLRAWELKATCWTVHAGGGAVCSTFKKRTTGQDQLPQPGQLNSCLEMVKAENS